MFDCITSISCIDLRASPGGLVSEESACNVGDLSSVPGLGRPPREGHGNPLQYSCLEKLHGQKSLMGCMQSVGSHRVGHDWVTKHSTRNALMSWALVPYWLYALKISVQWFSDFVPLVPLREGHRHLWWQVIYCIPLKGVNQKDSDKNGSGQPA